MKTILILLLLTASHFVNAQNSIDWPAVRQAYFDKYHPTDTPAWIFPIVFQEGNGGKDTVYFGYDPKAVSPAFGTDTAMGEKWMVPDSSHFQVYFYSSWTMDSLMKVYFNRSLGGRRIEFYNGSLPLTMWWDRNAFYSDSLPFPDQSPAPRGEGRLSYDLPMRTDDCSFQYPILITDSSKNKNDCFRTDSVVFEDDFNRPNIPPATMSLQIVPWQGELQIIQETDSFSGIQIFPVPATDFLIVTSQTNKLKFKIEDITGKVVYMRAFDKEVKIPVSAYPPGTYLINFNNETNTIQAHKKFLITR